jgi:hypothetical protein
MVEMWMVQFKNVMGREISEIFNVAPSLRALIDLNKC